MKLSKKVVVFLLLMIVVVSLFFYPVQGLELVTVNENHHELWIPLGKKPFTLEYIHSVDMLPVYETYYLRGGILYIQETFFHNFGIGMGETPGRGRYVEKDGLLGIVEINERVESFYLFAGPIAQPQIVVGDKKYDMVKTFGAGQRILLRGKRRHLGYLLESTASGVFYSTFNMLGG